MAEEKEFEVGSTVRLNSGGPTMTIKYYSKSDGKITCIFYNNDTHQFEELQYITKDMIFAVK